MCVGAEGLAGQAAQGGGGEVGFAVRGRDARDVENHSALQDADPRVGDEGRSGDLDVVVLDVGGLGRLRDVGALPVPARRGEMGDQQIGADEIVFDKDKNSGGQDTETEKAQPLSDAAMQALWLRRVQTKPADFLKAKFAYQLSAGEQEGNGE